MHTSYASLLSWAQVEYARKHRPGVTRILLGLGTCGLAAGAGEVLDTVRSELANEAAVEIVGVGCIGSCFREPLMDILKPGGPRISYSEVDREKAAQLVQDCVRADNLRPDLAMAVIGDHGVAGVPSWLELPFFKFQERRVLRRCGFIDPTAVEEYILQEGYAAAAKALTQMGPEDVIDMVKASGLRGRGGAGFPTGQKWLFARKSPGDIKYVVCNFDEGDPGAFMNRSTVEGDPHAVLEGMIIAAYAIGASKGYVYGRAEYPLALQRLRGAIRQAEELGLLGDNILGSGFGFTIEIKEGAGAFVCGEETALMASIEGQRGMPRPRPPFPAQSGLWGKPTNINNVGTLTNVPLIILEGPEWYAQVGSEKSKGTAIFCLTGKIKHGGLIEVPMGVRLRTVVEDIGGGIINDGRFKAAQTGGPSGGCLAEQHLDWPIDYESLVAAGSIMGSGGMVVMDQATCMVDFARFFLSFTQRESCGKCIPCRIGTKRMLEILERISGGQGELRDIDLLQELGDTVKLGSLCGLGQTAPNPVLATIRYFRQEYEVHIVDRRCPAGVCKALITYRVDPEKCTGCTVCARQCPVQAIHGEKTQIHVIDSAVCTRCDTCRQACRFDAIVVE